MNSLTLPAIILAVVIYKVVPKLISSYLWHKHSILPDIPLTSKRRPVGGKLRGTAIICGGSIAGLFAARVCANHFEKVIIVEPEPWIHNSELGLEDHHRDEGHPKRSRVAQYAAYHHFHLFMTSTMKEMFPSLEEAVKRIGGRLAFRRDEFWISGIPVKQQPGFPYYSGGIYPRVLSLTRPAFETTLRRLVLKTCHEVQYFHGTVSGLLYDETANRVTGVNVKLPNGEATNLEGALVVDATGPFLGGFRWLKALPILFNSQSTPLQDLKVSFDPKIVYSTCEFALPPKLEEEFRKYSFPTDSDDNTVVYVSVPTGGDDNRHVIIEKKERNFFHFVCGGYHWAGRIQSVDDIEAFLKELKPKQTFPDLLWDIVNCLKRENVPVSFIHSRCPPSVYIKYHEADYLPSNFVVVGDALSQSDPVNGQGCAKACAHSIILNAQLHQLAINRDDSLPSTFAKNFFLQVKERTEHIWTDLKNMDYDFSTTVPLPGESLQTTSRFVRSYASILLRLATKNGEVTGALYRQAAWLDPPSAMLAPWLLRRAAWVWIKQRIGYEIL